MKQTRYDTFQAKSWRQDSNGFLHFDETRPTRAGVFYYSNQNGDRWGELRHPDDVFKEDSLGSLKMLPFTYNHPGKLLSPETAKEHMHGTTGENVRRDGEFVIASLAVHDKGVIDSIIKDKRLELSCGYSCDVMDESGEYNGQQYTKRQTNIVYNHLASVKQGRAGEGCSIRLDSNSALSDIHESHKEEEIMTIIKREIGSIEVGVFKMDAMTVEIPEEHNGSVEALIGREKRFIDALTESTKREDTLQAKVDGLESENKEAKKTAEGLVSADRMDALVLERAEIMTKAKEAGIELAEGGSFEEVNKATKRDILLKTGKWKEDKLDSSDAYMDAAWDQLTENWEHQAKVIKSRENLENAQTSTRSDGEDPLTRSQRGN